MTERRYYLGSFPGREVSKAEYLLAEREAGCWSPLAPEREPFTTSFSGNGIHGWTECADD